MASSSNSYCSGQTSKATTNIEDMVCRSGHDEARILSRFVRLRV